MRRVVAHVFAALCIAGPAFGQQDLPKGEDIVAKSNAREAARSLRQTMHLKLVDESGKAKERTAVVLQKDDNQSRKLLMSFQEPATIRGTAILTYDYADPAKADEQWLFLPVVRVSRRIPPSDRGKPIFGSDFTFEDLRDMSRIAISDYTWSTTGKADVEGHSCYVVEAVPKTPDLAKELGYAKASIWVDSDIYVLRKSEFRDGKGGLLKTIAIRDIDQIDGIWIAHTFEAANQKSGHSSVLRVSDVDPKASIDDSALSVEALGHGVPDSAAAAR